MTVELPEGVIAWRNFAVKVEVSEVGGYCVHIYHQDRDGERWTHSQLGCGNLSELNTQLAIAWDQTYRRGIERGREECRVALGFAPGPVRR